MSTTDFIVRINGKDVKDKAAARMASIAPVEASTTAAHAYAVGKYFWLNDILYVATAAISAGGTITVGTNCAAAIIGDDVSGKLAANQGAANSGKVMTVNSAGGVVPAEVIGADLTVTEASLGGDDYNLQFNVINDGLAEDVVELAGNVGDLQTQMGDITTATSTDVNKALSPKTVTNGKVTEWQYKVIGGGGGGAFVIHEDAETGVLDKTWQEIFDALSTGQVCVIPYSSSSGSQSESATNYVCSAMKDVSNYYVYCFSINPLAAESSDLLVLFSYLTTDGPNGYPGPGA